MFVRKVGAVTVLVALLAFAGSAQAASVNSLMVLDGETENIASDESVEYLVDLNTSGTTGVLDVGDVLRGAINMNTLNGNSANVGGVTGNNQWTGVFSAKITGLHYNGIVANLPNYTIIFGVDDTSTGGGHLSFQDWLDNLDVDTTTVGTQSPDGPSLASGTMIRMFESSTSTVNFDSSTSADTNIATAATGDFYWDLGFAAASGQTALNADGSLTATVAEGWVGTGGIALASAGSGSSFGDSNFLFSLLQNGLGPVVKPQDVEVPVLFGLNPASSWTADFEGSVNVRGAGDRADNGFDLTNNAQFEFLAVPLPVAAWPGLVMILGIGAVRLRRRKRN